MLDFRLAVFLNAKMSGTPTKLIRELFQCQGRGGVQDIKQAYTQFGGTETFGNFIPKS